MVQDIVKNNVEPFRLFLKESILEIIKKNKFPLIPSIYFYNNDYIGDESITYYNNIKKNIKKFEIIKNFILTILRTSKTELEKINISDKKYKLNQDNLIITFDDDINKTFKNNNYFKDFINNFLKNKKNIFKNTENDMPYFYNIFQTEYLGKNKIFFINLFKQYIKIKKNILKKDNISKYNGILGFNMIFEIDNNINISKSQNIEKNKIKKNNINNNNYILLGNNINININIQKGGVNNSIINSNNNSNIYTENNNSNSNIYTENNNSNSNIYTENNNSNNENNNSNNENNNSNNENNKKFNKKNIKTLNDNNIVEFNKKIKYKKTLSDKIHNLNILYVEHYNEEYYISLHYNNLNSIYNNIITYKNNIIKNTEYNLYYIITNLIELEFNIIKFIFNYVDYKLFNKFIYSHLRIKKYIYDRINVFGIHYEEYIDWCNKKNTDYSNEDDDNITLSNFKKYFKKHLKNI